MDSHRRSKSSLLRAFLAVTVAAALGASAAGQERRLDLVSEMVADHNALRARAGVPPVTWDQQLAGHAQAWADGLVAEPGLHHSPHASRPGEGENLARIDGGRTSATDLFSGWAREGELYRYGPLNCADLSGLGRTGHFTQVIWRSTSRIGCAVAYAGQSQVLVCRYAPPGNICGQTPY
ncbi:MAG TPA: CAP family protein [Caulobacteraceae bacterium]|nr:CAP family protein [Caulobacteraceae bacterium]